MGRFQRTILEEAVPGSGYGRFRAYVRGDFEACCAYCYLHEFWGGGEDGYEIDHFRPKSGFPELAEHFPNLYWSCHVCNSIKKRAKWPSEVLQARGIGFVDLCRDSFEEHYRLTADGLLDPLTPSGDYTLEVLDLNSNHLIELRYYLRLVGHRLDHPPSNVFGRV